MTIMTVRDFYLRCCWTGEYKFCELIVEQHKPLFPEIALMTSLELARAITLRDAIMNREVLWFDIIDNKMVVCLKKKEGEIE